MYCFKKYGKRTEPCGDTSFNEGKEEDETKDNGVSSLDVGFLLVSIYLWLFGVAVGGSTTGEGCLAEPSCSERPHVQWTR